MGPGGKAWGVPLYQMLGGKYRDEVRMYCDTDVEGDIAEKEMRSSQKTNGNGFHIS